MLFYAIKGENDGIIREKEFLVAFGSERRLLFIKKWTMISYLL